METEATEEPEKGFGRRGLFLTPIHRFSSTLPQQPDGVRAVRPAAV